MKGRQDLDRNREHGKMKISDLETLERSKGLAEFGCSREVEEIELLFLEYDLLGLDDGGFAFTDHDCEEGR